jgi:hypothetical protein
MKTTQTRFALIALAMLLIVPTIAVGQRRRPTLRRSASRRTTARPVVPLVPVGTDLKVRLNDTLSSNDSRTGDRFTATVMDPVRFNEAMLRGHVSSIVKSGRIKGRTTMNLAFDSITLSDGRSAAVHGYVTRVYGDKGRTDQEGGVQSESRGRQTVKRGGIGATAGAIIGGIAGGGKGAAIGLILGGAAGAGSVAMNGGKELKIENGTEMLVHVTR